MTRTRTPPEAARRAAAPEDTPDRRSARLDLAEALADAHDEAHRAALRIAGGTAWEAVPAAEAGRHAGGPPARAARLFRAAGKDWPKLRLSLRGDDVEGYALVACVKAADGPDSFWETVGLPAALLRDARKMLQAAE